jgi:hypothetical protein
MRHALSAGVPPATAVAPWDAAATVVRAQREDGLVTGYTHASVAMPSARQAPRPIDSSAWQPTMVEHSGYKAVHQINPTFYPRNLGLSFKVERQIDRADNPYAQQPAQQPAPQWRRALQYPRAVITPPVYPIVQG